MKKEILILGLLGIILMSGCTMMHKDELDYEEVDYEDILEEMERSRIAWDNLFESMRLLQECIIENNITVNWTADHAERVVWRKEFNETGFR